MVAYLNIRVYLSTKFRKLLLQNCNDSGGRIMKKVAAVLLILALLAGNVFAVNILPEETFDLPVEAAVLMEKTTGEIIYEKNPHEKLPPASVTKVMTMLLVVEAIENGSIAAQELVTGSAHARSMGGSQIWLEDGEQMSVSEMLKCVAVVSANDCAVALAEHISGSEEAFVAKMNARAAELGCTDTNFKNCTGLFDDTEHYTSAADLAIMSRELIRHDFIKQYTTVWMDTVRNGAFGLSNTNKLVRFYAGATGLKTGYTSAAGHCLAATAERNGVEYIAVVLKGENSDLRFEAAKTLLNYAFANYTCVSLRPEQAIQPIPVKLGTSDCVQPVFSGDETMLLEKAKVSDLEYKLQLPQILEAPIKSGEIIGKLIVCSGGECIAEIDLASGESVDRMGTIHVFSHLFRLLVGKE